MELLTLENAARAGGAPMSRIGSSDPGCRGEDPINLEPDPRAAPFASMANSRTMSPPTRADTPHLGVGSGYGPTPAADGRADRPPPAAAPAAAPQGPPAARPRRPPHQRAGKAARGGHRPGGDSDPAGRPQPALPGDRPRRGGIGPRR